MTETRTNLSESPDPTHNPRIFGDITHDPNPEPEDKPIRPRKKDQTPKANDTVEAVKARKPKNVRKQMGVPVNNPGFAMHRPRPGGIALGDPVKAFVEAKEDDDTSAES
jgi:hypothetical protein